MKIIYRILERAGPNYDSTRDAEDAHERALEWWNANGVEQITGWYEKYQTARGHDPSDIIDPIDGLLKHGWEDEVIETAAAAILRGDA